MLKEEGIKLIPLPLRGDGFMLNSDEEKRIIEELSPYKGSKNWITSCRICRLKGKFCRAGADYAVIRVDASVDRCSQYKDGSVGKITDLGFTLMKEYVKCDKEYCPIESQWILNENV